MSTLTMTTFVTLDGVMQGPGGPDEDRSGGFDKGGWVIPLFDGAMGAVITDIFGRADAFVLGRRTFETFRDHWTKVTDPADPVAGPLNRLPKYVASRTLERPGWDGTTIVRDLVAELAAIKRRHAREVQVHGSAGLAQTLLKHDLVDELNLFTFPVVLGAGKRLFNPGAAAAAFTLVASRTSETGVVMATYRRSGAPRFATAPAPA